MGNNGRRWGVDFRSGSDAAPIEPSQVLVGCDLRGCSLDGRDLRQVQWIGCLVGGASLRGARLDGARFIACFAPADEPLALDENAPPLPAVDSHLRRRGAPSNSDSDGNGAWTEWQLQTARALGSERAEVRKRAARQLALDDARPLAPLLSSRLADREWDVRLTALQALGELRGAGFAHGDGPLVEWMCRLLGDPHALVRRRARRFAEAAAPPEPALLGPLAGLHGASAGEQLAALLAAGELRRVDARHVAQIDLARVEVLLGVGTAAVRAECMHLAGLLDGPRSAALLARGATDPSSAVRLATARALAALSQAPPELLASLAVDADPRVRAAAETLRTK